jgi:hypothetical protein
VIGKQIETRIGAIDWPCVSRDLDGQAWAIVPNLLNHAETDSIAGLHGREECFRSRVVMDRHGFGRGEYRYFSYPLPDLVEALRTFAYPRLAPIADRWQERTGQAARFPADHAAFLERRHHAGQTRPTPLLLKYGPDDYNCLHRDLYGEHVFPLQIALKLFAACSRPAARRCFSAPWAETNAIPCRFSAPTRFPLSTTRP